ncbi:hypothetical protein BJG93_04925 [Paraburkholderia sprentiae WSM5005]|uniref:Uncharacterized protein n=1 Tax=Paraburkholderia sprentiae WSM5005 TaxID=754502 RepID=A0A8F4KI50_9BURK|nr:hypothetical protein [Paraburkholderia sprentiae]QXE07192.1 hypothetical protein BJG93_04925 [Paraburkholderia sprentiae WSM5005]
MKLKTEWHTLREWFKTAAHAAQSGTAPEGRSADALPDPREWVIVYRTARGFCCMYRGEPVEFDEMLDVQIWSEEEDVRLWFFGL